jgi:hypothetical protein
VWLAVVDAGWMRSARLYAARHTANASSCTAQLVDPRVMRSALLKYRRNARRNASSEARMAPTGLFQASLSSLAASSR